MVKKYVKRVKIAGSSAVLAAFSISGVAVADSGIGMTGPNSTNIISSSQDASYSYANDNNVNVANNNSQHASSGDATTSGNTNGGGFGGNFAAVPWGNLSPDYAQQHGASFNDWWSNTMNWLAYNGSQSGAWMSSQAPVVTSWQPANTSWDSWNPQLWQDNGQSYNNWYNAMLAHLIANQSTLMNSWNVSGAGAGGAQSGDAGNQASNSIEAVIHNGSPVPGTVTVANPNGSGTISMTGPGSTNYISNDSSYDYTQTNNNDVTVANSNNQAATSGDAEVSGNTVGGGSASGAAGNAASNQTEVEIQN